MQRSIRSNTTKCEDRLPQCPPLGTSLPNVVSAITKRNGHDTKDSFACVAWAHNGSLRRRGANGAFD